MENLEGKNNLLETDLSTSPNTYRENIKIRETRNIYCGNCGKLGHTYRKCKLPITSCGIILYKNNKFFEEVKDEDGDIINNHERYYFLLIRRKDTLGYVEFLRGKYDEMNEDYLVKIFLMAIEIMAMVVAIIIRDFGLMLFLILLIFII